MQSGLLQPSRICDAEALGSVCSKSGSPTQYLDRLAGIDLDRVESDNGQCGS